MNPRKKAAFVWLLIAVLAVALPATAALAQSEDDLHDQLRATIRHTTIDLDFDETEFTDVIEDLVERTGLNIIIDQNILEDVEDEEITLHLSNLTVENALNIVCEFVELTYTFRYGVILITSPEEAYLGATVLRIYDVRDLTFKIKDFPGTRIRLRGNDTGTGGGGAGLIFEDEDEEFEPVSVDELEELIPEAVVPDSWDENPDAMIMQVSGMLLVRQTAEVHAEIQRLLSLLRQNR